MSATPNSLFRHYLDSLIQQGTTRTSLTDEARNVLRTWYVASRQGGRPAASAPASPEPPPLQAAVPVSAPAGKPEPPELFPQNREPASAITLPEGTMEDKLQYLRNLAQNWKPALTTASPTTCAAIQKNSCISILRISLPHAPEP